MIFTLRQKLIEGFIGVMDLMKDFKEEEERPLEAVSDCEDDHYAIHKHPKLSINVNINGMYPNSS